MNYYYYRLNAPRSTFAQDMTPEEQQVLGVHAEYWRALVAEGKVIVVGPVSDPRGAFGLAIVQLPDGEDPMPLGIHDPAITANMGFTFDLLSMPRVMVPD
jgi:uncharacterized protein